MNIMIEQFDHINSYNKIFNCNNSYGSRLDSCEKMHMNEEYSFNTNNVQMNDDQELYNDIPGCDIHVVYNRYIKNYYNHPYSDRKLNEYDYNAFFDVGFDDYDKIQNALEWCDPL